MVASGVNAARDACNQHPRNASQGGPPSVVGSQLLWVEGIPRVALFPFFFVVSEIGLEGDLMHAESAACEGLIGGLLPPEGVENFLA
jgi:hypothetical protein